MAKINIDAKKTTENIVEFIKHSVKKYNKNGIVLGLSGGIDSACVCALSAKAVGPDNVLCLIMPEKDSTPKSEEDAMLCAKTFGVQTKKIDLTPILEAFGVYEIIPKNAFNKKETMAKIIKLGYSLFPKQFSPFLSGLQGGKFSWQHRVQAYYRIKHRIRMVYLYFYGEQLNYLVVGAANKTEALTGYFVKWGCDWSADIMPIIHLYKTQVRQLSKYLGVPTTIIEKKPIPDLIPGIEDEKAIGLSYEKLDLILAGLTNGTEEKEIAKKLDISGRTISYVKKLIELSAHMRNLPDACK